MHTEIFLYHSAGEVTLVTLGPLTNIALALRLDPDLGAKVKEIITMGGNIAGKYDY